jgi:hypothetical protein
MFGWLSAASVWASHVNRASRSASFGKRVRQDLQRDIAIELRIAGTVDLTHASFADLGRDFVDAEAGAKCESQR